MSSDAFERVLSCPSLPSLPSVAVQILELTRDSNVSLRDIAKVVEQDQALTGKILRTVNSSFYGLAQPCGTVDRALNYLGLNTVKSLVLGFSLVESTKGVGEDTDFSLETYWSRTIYTATAARILAIQFRRTDPDEAFTSALFQDIGVLAAVTALKGEYLGPLGEDLFKPNLQVLEKETVEFTHTQVGAALAEKWRLPKSYIDVIEYHHEPENAPASAQQVVRVAVLGRVAADVLTGGKTAKSSLRKFEGYTNEWFGQGFKEAELQFEEIAKAAHEVGKLFEQQIEQSTNISVLMSEAQDRAIEVQISSEQESFRDGLTGISNRKHFDSHGERMFEEARSSGVSIAVLFCDGDRFKSVNDTLGHQAGDAVLVEMAKRISDVIGDSGEAFRYGGEEFSIVLPGFDMDQAADIAERIRAAMEAKPVDLSSVDCQVDEHVQTLSFGVAAGIPGSSHALERLSSLVKAADDAVYLAKENGRNRVEKAAVEDAAPVETQTPAPRPAAPEKPRSPGIVRILLVEDDPLSATLWRTMLAKSEGVEVAQATGRRGVEKLLTSGYEPNVVVTDYMLGSGTGVDVVIAVRKKLGESVPILLISAQLDRERVESALSAGATACASKTDICKRFKFWIELVVSGDFDEKAIAG